MIGFRPLREFLQRLAGVRQMSRHRRTRSRIRFAAAGLIAGVKLTNIPVFRPRTRRGRKQYPRKSNFW